MEIDQTFILTLNAAEFNAVQLACSSMLEDDLTHQYWIDTLEPMVIEMNEILGVEGEW